MAEIGMVLWERYELQRFLGRGGTADVYLAWDKKNGRFCAVKEMLRGEGEMELSQMAAMLKGLYHPALPRVYEAAKAGDAVYVIMDYVEGISLGRLLQEKGPQPQYQVAEWGRQLCRILIYLHSRKPPLLYRDLKPDNIMLQEDGTLKLIDFGTMMPGERGRKNDCLGTRGYAAPEQYVKRGRIDQRTDIYCLGVTLHQMLTGYQPVCEGKKLPPVRGWNPSISPAFEKLIVKCTRKSPLRRYQDCRELLKALELM